MAEHYAAADIFYLPSLEEGLPVRVVQTMVCGLPVVATPETRAADILRDGVNGRIVPSGDPPALTIALGAIHCCDRWIGDHARRIAATGYGWADYGRRAVTAYECLLQDK